MQWLCPQQLAAQRRPHLRVPPTPVAEALWHAMECRSVLNLLLCVMGVVLPKGGGRKPGTWHPAAAGASPAGRQGAPLAADGWGQRQQRQRLWSPAFKPAMQAAQRSLAAGGGGRVWAQLNAALSEVLLPRHRLLWGAQVCCFAPCCFAARQYVAVRTSSRPALPAQHQQPALAPSVARHPVSLHYT